MAVMPSAYATMPTTDLQVQAKMDALSSQTLSTQSAMLDVQGKQLQQQLYATIMNANVDTANQMKSTAEKVRLS